MERPTSDVALLPTHVRENVDRLIEADKVFELMALPYEVRLYTLAQLRYPDLMRFCVASKEAAKVCEDNYFWEIKTRRDFGDRFPEVHHAFPTHKALWKDEYTFYMNRVKQLFLNAITHNELNRVRDFVEFGIDLDKPIRIRKYSTVDMVPSRWVSLWMKNPDDPAFTVPRYPAYHAARWAANHNDTTILGYLLEQGASTKPFEGQMHRLCRLFQGPTCGEIRDLIRAYS